MFPAASTMVPVLELPISYFFEGLDSGKRVNAEDTEMAETIRRKSLELVRNFYSIEDERVREAAYQLIKGMAKTGR